MRKKQSSLVEKRIAIVGNPNTGKSSIFNALTGAKSTVGNWPGVTIERTTAVIKNGGFKLEIDDLPGVYSLSHPNNNEEQYALNLLFDRHYQLLINVIDSANLERNLCLTLQLMEIGAPMLLVCNMSDVAIAQNLELDTLRLAQMLKIPVAIFSAHDPKAVERLQVEITRCLQHSDKPTPNIELYPRPIVHGLHDIREALSEAGLDYSWRTIVSWIEGATISREIGPKTKGRIQTTVERVREIIEEDFADEPDLVIASVLYQISYDITQKVQPLSVNAATKAPDKLDRMILYGWRSIPLFLIVMYLTFATSIWIGSALQPLFAGVAWGTFAWLEWLLGSADIPVSLWLLLKTMTGGIALVLSFMPILLILYFIMAMLEESGYLARAAFVIDRFLKTVGLPGKAIIPMIVGLGCNVPGILASKNLENKRDRITVAMMMPFMSCSARLSVYSVFCAAFFPHNGHNVVFMLYIIGIVMALVTGVLCRSLLPMAPSYLLLELPRYQMPDLRNMAQRAWNKTWAFVWGAGKAIVCAYIFITMLSAVDVYGRKVDHIQDSIIATAGKSAVPVFATFGITEDNWPASVSIITGVLAKEVVIGTLDELYRAEFYANTQISEYSLSNEVTKHFHGAESAIAYLLFILLYFPCVATLITIGREIGWQWAWLSTAWSMGVGYTIAVIFWQSARVIGLFWG